MKAPTAAPRHVVQPDAVLEVAYGVLDLGVAAMIGLQFQGLPIAVGDEGAPFQTKPDAAPVRLIVRRVKGPRWEMFNTMTVIPVPSSPWAKYAYHNS